ncbi:MAG: methyltransferase domain-containing protein [Saccharospirillaceae bacterium]|nr:methyltransferase domain-containing protein [Pseudomonadales bacterium]NRB77891.1 methyltransferase domain-containing protein [Saccharospirillaceae bacterium]
MVKRVTKPIKQWFSSQGASPSAREYHLNTWFHSPLGQYIIKKEKKQISTILNSKVGQHILQLDCGLYEPLFDIHRFGCGTLISLNENRALCPTLCCHPEALGIASESVDVILAHHLLDYCDNPYDSLREISRVLVPGGECIFVGFNPYSLWYVRAFFTKWFKKTPWNARFTSYKRIQDWIQLLDFEIQESYSLAYAPPSRKFALSNTISKIFSPLRYLFPWSGAVNIIVAKKKTLGMILNPQIEQNLLLHAVHAKKIAAANSTHKTSNDKYQD